VAKFEPDSPVLCCCEMGITLALCSGSPQADKEKRQGISKQPKPAPRLESGGAFLCAAGFGETNPRRRRCLISGSQCSSLHFQVIVTFRLQSCPELQLNARIRPGKTEKNLFCLSQAKRTTVLKRSLFGVMVNIQAFLFVSTLTSSAGPSGRRPEDQSSMSSSSCESAESSLSTLSNLLNSFLSVPFKVNQCFQG
jgi:hypothetical protein